MTLAGGIEIPITANADEFNRQITRAITPGINALNRAIADGLQQSTRDLGTLGQDIADALDITDEYRRVMQELVNETGNTAKRIEQDLADLGARQLDQFEDRIEDIGDADITAEFNIDGDETIETLTRGIAQVDNTPIDADFNLNGSEQIPELTRDIAQVDNTPIDADFELNGAEQVPELTRDIAQVDNADITAEFGVNGTETIETLNREIAQTDNTPIDADFNLNGSEQVPELNREIAQVDNTPIDAKFELEGTDSLAALRREIASTDDNEIRAKLDVIGEEDLDVLRRTIERISNTPIRIDADGNPAASEIQDIQQRLQRIVSAVVVISGDNSRARAEIEEVIGLTEAIERIQPAVNVNVKDEAIREAAGLAEDLNQTVEIEVEADTAEAESKLEGFAEDLDYSNIGASIAGALSSAFRGTGPVGLVLSGAGLAGGALYVDSLASGIERQQDRLNLAIRTGFDEQDLAEVGAASAEVYAAGFGESLGEIREIAATVKGELEGIDDSLDLTQTTKELALLSDTFGVDLPSNIRLLKRLVAQELIPDVGTGLDLLVSQAQQFGNDFEEGFEVLNEFAPFFARLGVEGGTALTIINGLWADGLLPNIDRGAELFEEFIVEVSTGSDTARSAVEELGLNFDDIQTKLADGRGAQALAELATALVDVDDKAKQAELTTSIFRASIEGAADPEAVLQYLALADSITEVGDSADVAASRVEESLGASLQAFRAEWDLAIADFQTALLESFTGEGEGDLVAAAENLGALAGTAIGEGMAAGLPAAVEGVFTSFLPSLLDGLIPEWELAGVNLGDGLVQGISTVMGPGLVDAALDAEGVGAPGTGIARIVQSWFDDADPDTEAIEGNLATALDGVIDNVAAGADRDLEARYFTGVAEDLDELGGAAEEAEPKVVDVQEALDGVFTSLQLLDAAASGDTFRQIAAQGQALVEQFAAVEDSIVNALGEFDRSTEAGRNAEAALEGQRALLIQLAQEYANGAKSASQFGEGQVEIERFVRSALEQLELPGPLIESLVEDFGRLDELTLQEIGVAVAVRRDELDTATLALEAFAQLSPVVQAEIDLDSSGLVEADEALVALNNAERNIEIGFDVNGDGEVDLLERGRAIDRLNFLAGIGFDVDYDEELGARERAQAFGLIRELAQLGFDVDGDGVQDAEEQGLQFALETWLASIGYELDDTEIVRADQLGVAFESRDNTRTIDGDASPFFLEINDATNAGIDLETNPIITPIDGDASPLYGDLAEAGAVGDAFESDPIVGDIDGDVDPYLAAISSAGAAGSEFASRTIVGDIAGDSGGYLASVNSAGAAGDAFASRTIVGDIDGNTAPFDGDISSATNRGNQFASTDFVADLGADISNALSGIGSAERAGAGWNGRVLQAIVRARDEASGVINSIARNRVVTLRVRQTGSNQIIGNDGMIIPAHTAFMNDGGTLDGIARANGAGVFGQYGAQPFLMAENGFDELFINAGSDLSRQIDLIERFANGRLDEGLRRHYLADTAQRFQDGGTIPGRLTPPAPTAAASGNSGSMVVEAINHLAAVMTRQAARPIENHQTFIVQQASDVARDAALIDQLYT